MYSKFPASVAALIVIASTFPGVQTGFAQPLPDSMKTKVDNIFKRWDSAGSPGCVVGIVRNDSVVYARGYGLANVEENVPNTPRSVYYICSLAKQFTGYAVVLLARQGKLKLDDDIHLYLPWMTDFGHKITIRNLLNHTSGIRDEADMARISGLPLEGRLTQQMAVGIIKRQRTLNFTPGERYAYSNSNYVLLAEIVENVSGESFSSFIAQNIFSPLGMTHSGFMDDSREIIKARAASYKRNNGIYENAYEYANVLGAGSMFSTVEDMARWAMNFYFPRVGDAKDIEQLVQKGKLNSGEVNDYALGISVDSSRGWTMYSHNGSLAGYITHIRVYPDLKMAFIIFSNAGDDRVFSAAGSLAALFVPDRRKPAMRNPVRLDSSAALLKNTESLRPIEGDYLAENGYWRNFAIRNRQLWMNKGSLMVQKSPNTVCELEYPDWQYVFHVNKTDTTVDFYRPGLSQPIRFTKRVRGLQLSDEELEAYTGIYYSPELLCTYQIVLRDHQLFYTSNLYPDDKITLMGRNDLLSDYSFFSHVIIFRSERGKIAGFKVSNADTGNLRFDKIR
jgi:CubicO group peptidase (beta-lactamase class C family)